MPHHTTRDGRATQFETFNLALTFATLGLKMKIESRYAHLFSGQDFEAQAAPDTGAVSATTGGREINETIASMEQEISRIRQELDPVLNARRYP